MAFQYGAWQAPQAATLDNLLQGFQFGRGLRDDNDARKSLAALVDSEYGRGVNQQQPKGLAELAGAGNMVNQSVQSAYGATDPKLAAMLPGYLNSIKQAESGGNPNAKNPNSSATGLYQFTEGTWADLAKNNPNLMLTPDGRADPAQQERAIRAFTQQNAASLSKAGIGVNPGSLYAAHFLGPGGAQQAYGLPDDTPMIAAVGAEVVQANPFLANMTVGQFKQWSAEKGGNARGGYQAPMMDQGQPMGAAVPANGLPPVEILKSLVQNPQTREIGLSYLQMGQQGQQKLTSDMQEYQLAQSQGYQGSFMDYMTGLKSAGADKPTADIQNYQYYVDQEKAAGREPKPFAEWGQTKTRAPMTPTIQKEIFEADEGVIAGQSVVSALTKAMELNNTAWEGPFADQTSYAGALAGNAGARDTQELKNLVTAQALDQLRATFGAMPTEGERKILLEIQGSVSQPRAVRERIFNRAIEAANRRIAVNQKKAEALRNGTYFDEGFNGGQNGWQDAGDGVRIRVKE